MTTGTPAPGTPAPGRTATIKRAIKHVVVFALLASGGVVMSYAVAWGAVWQGDLGGGKHIAIDAILCSELQRNNGEGPCWESWHASQITKQMVTLWTSGRDVVRDWDCSDASAVKGSPRSLLPNWAAIDPARWSIPASPRPFVIQSDWRTIIAWGWPARCCWCEMPWRGSSGYEMHLTFPPEHLGKKPLVPPGFPITVEGGIRLKYFFTHAPGYPPLIRALPLRPIYPGLLLNAALYGGILWLLWLMSAKICGMIHRAIRRRRGLCMRCGYDLRGSAAGAPCPECGGGLP